jgi:hypothetical protein
LTTHVVIVIFKHGADDCNARRSTEDGSDYLYPDTHSFEKNGRIVTVAEYFRVLHEDHAATPVSEAASEYQIPDLSRAPSARIVLDAQGKHQSWLTRATSTKYLGGTVSIATSKSHLAALHQTTLGLFDKLHGTSSTFSSSSS